MTVAQSLIAFFAAAGLLTITPGLDTALVLRTAATGGARRAASTAAGIGVGLLTWGVAASLGVAALLTASHAAFTVLRWAGAGYLAVTGLKLILKPRERFVAAAAPERTESGWAAFRRGLLTNLLNPKIGIFYVSFLPQFTPRGVDVPAFMLLLALIHLAQGAAWFAALIAATGRLTGWLSRRGVMRALDRLTGAVFIGFGLKLALSER